MTHCMDLARLAVLVLFDATALKGYTGAVVHKLLDGAAGLGFAVGALLVQLAVPAAQG